MAVPIHSRSQSNFTCDVNHLPTMVGMCNVPNQRCRGCRFSASLDGESCSIPNKPLPYFKKVENGNFNWQFKT